MSITINAKGTSVPFFTIGKNGTTMYQGSVDPSLIYTMKNSDVWFDTTNHSISSWSTAASAWQAPRLADLNFTNSTIVAGSSSDLTLKVTSGNNVVLDAGAGDPRITALTGKDLYLTESIGGSLYINAVRFPAGDGTANQILATDGSGTLSWTNSVTSLSGTTNQISVSGSTGNITLSTPSTFIAPGTLQYTSQLGYSQETLTAAGTTQGGATAITKTYSRITAGSAGQGVRLPAPTFTGELHVIENCTANVINIWPQSGGSVDHQTTDASTFIDPEGTVTYIWNGTTWNSITDNVVAGNSGITVTHSGGTASVSNNGVLTFSGGTTGLTPASATNGAVTLGGILTIGAGGTNAATATAAFDNLSPLTTAGDTLYHNGTNNVRLPIGTSTQVLSVVAGAPSWISQSAMNVGSATSATTATNIAGGANGSVPYQTASGTTTFLSVGTANQVLTVVGGVPTWQSVTTALGYTPVNKAGDTMSGALNMGSFNITNLAAPSNANDAATKAYVDAAAAGLTILGPVKAASTTTLTATYTAGSTDANGGTGIGATLTNSGTQAAFSIDGYSASLNDRILIKDQTDAKQNGIYTVTTVGTGSTNWVLTRATDYDDSTANQVKSGTYVLIQNGSQANQGWIMTSTGTIVIGTNNIVWTQFSSSNSYSAGTGLSLTGSTFANTGVLSITTSSGLSTNTSATGNVSITNTGVTSVTAGTGISVSGSTGSVTISATAPTIQNKTSNYTVLTTDGTIFANASGGAFTVTLPASPTAGEIHSIKKVDNTRLAVTLSGNGNNIDNYSTVTINVPYMSIEVQWNSTTSTWQII